MDLKFPTLFLLACVCAAAALIIAGCASDDPPPYYTARITNVYNEAVEIERFRLLYWWQERGETPFLKPHDLAAKEVIAEKLAPLNDDTKHVEVKTLRIAFADLRSVDIGLTGTGKRMVITKKNGEAITTGMAFPRSLRVDPDAGFADMKVFVTGIRRTDTGAEDFKLALDYVKNITITGSSGS